MARTLFFLEATVLCVLSAFASALGELPLEVWLLPVGTMVVLPVAAASAVWPLRSVGRAFAHAFSAGRPGPGAGDSLRILEALGRLALLGGGAAAIAALMSLLREADEGVAPRALLWQVLAFALLGLLLALCLAILRGAVERAAAPPRNEDVHAARGDFALRWGLSAREAEVAVGLVEGWSYKEIGERLFISVKTVKTHASHVYEKTETPNRAALMLSLRAETGDSYQRPMDQVGSRGDGEGKSRAGKAEPTGGGS
jgi:DNA-binding CsgD family transcriptional regulator